MFRNYIIFSLLTKCPCSWIKWLRRRSLEIMFWDTSFRSRPSTNLERIQNVDRVVVNFR